jgi:hypothetical protein
MAFPKVFFEAADVAKRLDTRGPLADLKPFGARECPLGTPFQAGWRYWPCLGRFPGKTPRNKDDCLTNQAK